MGIEYINIIKKRRGMTSEDLSIASGVPLGTLNKILSGQTLDPKFDTLKAICVALEISVAELDDSKRYDEDLSEYLEELHKRPEMKTLFSLAKGATKEEVEQVVKMIEVFKKQAGE